MTTKDILIQFEEKCIKTADGKCKYFNPEAFGYAQSDTEAPLDKFFPEQVKSFLSTSISKLLDEVVEACEKDKVLSEEKDGSVFTPVFHADTTRGVVENVPSFNQGLSTAIEIINSKR